MALVAEDVQKSKRPAAAPTESLPVCVQLVPSQTLRLAQAHSLSFMKKTQDPLENVPVGTHLWVILWGRIMGKGEKHLNRMERDETLLLLLSMGMSLEGNVGAGSNTSYVLESTLWLPKPSTFIIFLSLLSTLRGRQDRAGVLCR